MDTANDCLERFVLKVGKFKSILIGLILVCFVLCLAVVLDDHTPMFTRLWTAILAGIIARLGILATVLNTPLDEFFSIPLEDENKKGENVNLRSNKKAWIVYELKFILMFSIAFFTMASFIMFSSTQQDITNIAHYGLNLIIVFLFFSFGIFIFIHDDKYRKKSDNSNIIMLIFFLLHVCYMYFKISVYAQKASISFNIWAYLVMCYLAIVISHTLSKSKFLSNMKNKNLMSIFQFLFFAFVFQVPIIYVELTTKLNIYSVQ